MHVISTLSLVSKTVTQMFGSFKNLQAIIDPVGHGAAVFHSLGAQQQWSFPGQASCYGLPVASSPDATCELPDLSSP
jgi:hypothetical protein